ncbi:MAG: DUF6036 family nucleotidyltransferase [Gemmatimonadota bacterium]
MRRELTREALRELMEELARTAPAGESFRVYVVGGGTAVLAGWRGATIDADLYAEREEVFRDVQAIKKRLRLNIELVRPEQFVPPLAGSVDRHVFIERVGHIDFYHYDPYAQLLSKIVRGFRKDLLDAEHFVGSGMVDAERFRELVEGIPDSAYARYPNLSRDSVLAAVDDVLSNT